ncbi:non-hydrolyzing UDP-N-acetylglucosamine 2-epimerase [Haloarchaeobius sp. TZWSO28]|uniref:non-hydrolyzing UDP-N-acetylglucosamine 2-epimerase n=1 Tax=Haloarchaeobius sp. TZWSO28 TaxID=3446119 RepID=UPI003EB75B81
MDVSTSDEGHQFLFVVGTRPEIIKMASVIRVAWDRPAVDCVLVHTNQHYDEELSDVFFRTLQLPEPDENLGVGSDSHARQTASGLVAIDEVIESYDPDVVFAQGDTNTVLSAALATSKREPLFAHVEAGIRSGDQSMPEEVNRILVDDVSDLLFAPTTVAADNLSDEGISENVFVTGNTVVDACRENAQIAAKESTILERFDYTPGEYAVATIHRPHNTDDPGRLRSILDVLDAAACPVVLPAHPRTHDAIDGWKRGSAGSVRVVEPLDYLDFLKLLSNARVVVTDSGGVQEEASILQVPCLTVRNNTERPETLDAGVNELVTPATLGDRLSTLLRDDEVHESMRGSPDLYGDGSAGTQIVERTLRTLTELGGTT